MLRQRPYDNLVKYKGLLDIEKYVRQQSQLVKAKGWTLSVSRVKENFKHGLMKGALPL